MVSNPLRDWGLGLLVLGGVVLAFAVAMAVAEVLVLSATDRGYAFSGVTAPGIVGGAVLLGVGAVLWRASYPRDPRSPSRAK